jgi:5-methylcytosine-specific restriction endonuclease McrA
MTTPYKDRLYQRNRKLVLAAAGWRCSRCGGPANTADHVVPLALGGDNRLSNLRAMCRRCNSSLGAHLVNEELTKFARRRSRRW